MDDQTQREGPIYFLSTDGLWINGRIVPGVRSIRFTITDPPASAPVEEPGRDIFRREAVYVGDRGYFEPPEAFEGRSTLTVQEVLR